MADPKDTICALSSAPGRSGIAVLRMSGPACFEILGDVFRPAGSAVDVPDRRAVLGMVRDPQSGNDLDQALATCFHAPHSFTGEDVAELSVHGSPVVVARLLEILCDHGARLATPGEFTLRAFLNGRLDLVQAEAVRDVIEAHTFYQLQAAGRQQSGELSRQLQSIRRRLIGLIVSLETAVEFVEEDLAFETRDTQAVELERVIEELGKWVSSFRHGRIVRDGFSLALVGLPNVGKSSLFNALLAFERSIVSEFPGTTRDLVSEYANIAGVPVRLIDTAGLRDDAHAVERIGVERSLGAIADADAIVLVLDPSRPYSGEDERLRERLRSVSCLVAFNKCDLAGVWTAVETDAYASFWPCIEVSARTGAHIEGLQQAIRRHLFGDDGVQPEGPLVTNLRHCRCLEAARVRLLEAAGALRGGLSEEFVIADLRGGLQKLGEITGETTAEDLLGEIFSRFCIGK